MREISVRINRLRVSSVSVLDGSAVVDIDFDDGKEKRVYRTTVFKGDIEQIALNIINEIKNMERNIHFEFNDDNVLKSFVNVLISEENATMEKIISFLSKVSDHISKIKSAKMADGYMDMIRKLQGMQIEL